MAEKKKKQTTTFLKEENIDFHNKEVTEFQKGRNAEFQPRDDNIKTGKEGQTTKTEKAHNQSDLKGNGFIEKAGSGNAGRIKNNTTPAAKKTSKAYAKKIYRETFGQNVQKSGTEVKQEEKKKVESDFVKEDAIFTKQDFSQTKSSKFHDRQMCQKTFGQNVQKSGTEAKQEEKKKAKSDFVKNDTIFTQQDLSVKKSVQAHGRQTYGKTFGQNVQKFGAKEKQEEKKKEKSDFIKDDNIFSQQDFAEQQEEAERKQDFTEDYHHRDTYRQFQKKGRYHKKRVRKAYQNRKKHRQEKKQEKSQSENTGFTNTASTDFKDSADTGFKDSVDAEFTGSKKLQKKKKQAERAGQKAEKARAKLPKKKEYTLQRVFDEETGRGKYVVVPIEKEKPLKREGIPKSDMRRLQNEGKNFVHGKIAENEKENSAVEGAHKTEQKAEDFYGFVKRHYKGKGQRQRAKVAKLEKKQFQKEVNFRYQKFLEENPKMQKKALQKRLQKQRIKREYMKAKRNGPAAKHAQEAVSKTANTATAIAKKLQEMAGKHAGILVTVGIIAILLMMVMTSMSSCGAMFADTQSMVLAASYLSEPKEIDAADLQFTRLELDLQNEIDNMETDYPGYDEYSYNLGAIGHNPFTLINYLSAVYTEFTASEVENKIQELFKEMYTLTTTAETETRTRQVQATDEEENPLYDENGNPVMEEEEYEVSVLRVVLIVKPLETIVVERMDTEQTEIFAMYAETGGLLQQFASPVDLYWYNYISSYYGYRKNPSTGKEELHRGVDIAVPTGTKVYAAHDGTVTTATYDSYYGNYVVIEKDGYTTKYAHMDSLSVSAGQEVTKGTVIGTTGNTGSSTGSHLHIECLYNGEYYNPLFYFDVGTKTLYGENTDGGTTGSGGTGGNAIPPDSYADATVQALMEEAAKYLGYPYVWGGSSPSTSFDCSGFVCWVFTNSGVHNLPRTTAQGIYDQCTPVSPSEAKAGDIIFFTGTYNSAGAVSHVGIYCGNGVMIHCGDPISYASINTSYWQSHFYAFGRLN